MFILKHAYLVPKPHTTHPGPTHTPLHTPHYLTLPCSSLLSIKTCFTIPNLHPTIHTAARGNHSFQPNPELNCMLDASLNGSYGDQGSLQALVQDLPGTKQAMCYLIAAHYFPQSFPCFPGSAGQDSELDGESENDGECDLNPCKHNKSWHVIKGELKVFLPSFSCCVSHDL